MQELLNEIKFDSAGLIPAVICDYLTNKVLMVAYMNKQALKMSIETKKATYFSRSRQEIWVKGKTSGNYQYIQEILLDCDADCLLIKVEQVGNSCHTGNKSCFFRKIENQKIKNLDIDNTSNPKILSDIYQVIKHRSENPKEGSYTNYLLDKGIDKILKKVGEETAEVIIGAKNASKEEISYEVADLMYHLSVMLFERGVRWQDIYNELEKRYK